MSNKDILESIKKCEGFVGAILKIKRSRYEVIDYDYYLGFFIKKISGKKENYCIRVSLSQMVNGINAGKIEMLDIKEQSDEVWRSPASYEGRKKG